MKYTAKQYAQALVEVLETAHPNSQDKVIDNFIQVLKDNGDLAAYEKIVNEYEKIIDVKSKTSQVEVSTATGAAIAPSILKELNEFTKEKIEVTEKTDEEILGGVVIRVDDTLIDASLKTQLNNLEDTLKD